MANRGTLKILACIGVLTALLSCGGVYSNWLYAEQGTTAGEQTLSIYLREFDWTPEEVLPDEDEEGKNHLALVNSLIDGDDGLNDGTWSYLNRQIATRKNFWSLDTLGSMGLDQQTELENLFGAGSKNLAFLILLKSDTEYYIFTLDKTILEGDSFAVGKTIAPVYKTVAVKRNGTWETQTSTKGYATSAYYEESWGHGTQSKIPSFDPDSWVAGAPPTN